MAPLHSNQRGISYWKIVNDNDFWFGFEVLVAGVLPQGPGNRQALRTNASPDILLLQ